MKRGLDPAPDGGLIHAEFGIGNSIAMLTDDAQNAPGRPCQRAPGDIVPDVDIVWQRALAAGAEIIFALADQCYGQRSGRLRDPFGHR